MQLPILPYSPLARFLQVVILSAFRHGHSFRLGIVALSQL